MTPVRIDNGGSGCRYPQSWATARPIRDELRGVAANGRRCTSFYLDTREDMSNDIFSSEGEDHHQGLARTPVLSDGSIRVFLSHSELDEDDRGSLTVYRYTGPLEGEHVMDADPPTVARLEQAVMLDERHPSDIEFLPDVDGLDAGYVFVTLEYDRHTVAVHRWSAAEGLVPHGVLRSGFPTGGPGAVFADRVGDTFHVGVASERWGWGQLLCAQDRDLFPGCAPGALDVAALKPAGMFPYPVRGASQTKLVRDSRGVWYLLGFRGDPADDPRATDYIDVHEVAFAPFRILPLLFSVHVVLRPGDTGFASTGTHHVEPSGRLLIGSSYRWAKDEGPGESSFVSRVDECPSS